MHQELTTLMAVGTTAKSYNLGVRLESNLFAKLIGFTNCPKKLHLTRKIAWYMSSSDNTAR